MTSKRQRTPFLCCVIILVRLAVCKMRAAGKMRATRSGGSQFVGLRINSPEKAKSSSASPSSMVYRLRLSLSGKQAACAGGGRLVHACSLSPLPPGSCAGGETRVIAGPAGVWRMTERARSVIYLGPFRIQSVILRLASPNGRPARYPVSCQDTA